MSDVLPAGTIVSLRIGDIRYGVALPKPASAGEIGRLVEATVLRHLSQDDDEIVWPPYDR